MTKPEESDAMPGRRVTLRAKLVIAAVAVAAVMCVFLFAYFGPRAKRSFLDRSESLISGGAAALRTLAESDNENSQQVLHDVIHHTADARSRSLQDLPLSLYEGDARRIRQAIEEQDAARAIRLAGNIRLLARELQRRTDAKIDHDVKGLVAEQRATSEIFGADLRTSYLVLSGFTLATLIVLLALGLDRFIVRPIHQLRALTRQVADGDLTPRIDVHSGDEVGDLAGDFAVMVDRLRASREEIRQKNEQLASWNQTLQKEVDRKTHHLETALTDLQSTQNKLLQADKMASIGTLAGGIAHEFNNVIGGIRGCIADVLGDRAAATHREPLEVALRATERATSITEKLLRFARPRMGARTECVLATLVAEVVDLVEPQARRQDVKVNRSIADDISILVDAGEMHQVFLNLFTNALQAMPNGGRLSISANHAAAGVEIRVSDTGVGIPPEQLSSVFDPFFSSRPDAIAPTSSGTGLGLAVSFGIVEAHGGQLTVESERGAGTVFEITLPTAARGGEST